MQKRNSLRVCRTPSIMGVCLHRRRVKCFSIGQHFLSNTVNFLTIFFSPCILLQYLPRLSLQLNIRTLLHADKNIHLFLQLFQLGFNLVSKFHGSYFPSVMGVNFQASWESISKFHGSQFPSFIGVSFQVAQQRFIKVDP